MGWGIYVSDRVENLENDLRRVPPAHRTNIEYILAWAGLRDARILTRLPTISADLDPPAEVHAQVPTAATAPHRRGSVLDWWIGDRAEQAYASLHRADAAYLGIAPDAIVRQRAADLLSELPACALPSSDLRYSSYQQTLKAVANPPAPGRDQHAPAAPPAPAVPPAPAPAAAAPVVAAAVAPVPGGAGGAAIAPLDPPIPVSTAVRQTLKEIAEVVGQSSANQHYLVRTYRNLLFITAAGLLLLYLLLSLIGWRDPNFLSLCASNATSQPPCPSGAAPGSGDIFLLGFAGLVGGAVGALILLLSVSISGGPFTLAVAQAVLKLPAGATIALVGLFVLQHGILGILTPQSGTALVAWAIIFGVGQQALTQTIDKRANAIMAGGSSANTAAPAAAAAHP